MRTALCFSGQSRTFQKCLRSQKKYIIDVLNPDIFIHSWSFRGDSRLLSSHDHRFKIDDYKKYIKENKNIIPAHKLIAAYSPKKFLIENPNPDYFIDIVRQSGRYEAHGFDKLFDNHNKYKWFNCLMMYYSIYQSNNLKQNYERDNGFKYDMVIRCRMDLLFRKASFVGTIGDIQDNVIYLAPNENIDIKFNKHMKQQLKEYGIQFMPNDQFAYGSSSAMDYYASVYEKFKENIDCYSHHGEGALTDHLWRKNTSIYQNIKANLNIKIKIKR